MSRGMQPMVTTRSGYTFPMPAKRSDRDATVHANELGVRVLVDEHAENYGTAEDRIATITKRSTKRSRSGGAR